MLDMRPAGRRARGAGVLAPVMAPEQDGPVTRWQHARVMKGIVNLDSGTGRLIVCGWDDCERRGTSVFTVVRCRHDPRMGCEAADAYGLVTAGQVLHMKYVFCSERHRAYWLNADGPRALASIERTGRAYGNLPAGFGATL